MLTMDLKARLKNKTWWITIIGTIILLVNQCGFDLSEYIPGNYADIVNSIFIVLAMVGITVDTSTKGISDQVISDATVQAINSEAEVKTESGTTSINNTVIENSQESSADASASASDKENEELKAQIAVLTATNNDLNNTNTALINTNTTLSSQLSQIQNAVNVSSNGVQV